MALYMNKAIVFTIGVAAGSVATWLIVREKYRKLADEEIASVVERFKNREKIEEGLDEIKETYEKKPNKYPELVEGLEYSVRDLERLANGEEIQDEDKPYEIFVTPGVDRVEPFVISPDEFGEIPDFDTETWHYYTDGVLVNTNEEIVDDAELYIGDALSHFGEFADDCVHVRNENIGIECDYEILRCDAPFNLVDGGLADDDNI